MKPRCHNCDRPYDVIKPRYAISLDCGATVEILVGGPGANICRRCLPKIIAQYFREEVNTKPTEVPADELLASQLQKVQEFIDDNPTDVAFWPKPIEMFKESKKPTPNPKKP